MIESIPKVDPPTDPAAKPAEPGAAAQTRAQAASAAAPGVRLYVDHNETGVYTYRLVDVTTGRLLVEVPRERLDELTASPDYTSGALVSTSA